MSTARFSLAVIASKVFETETWLKMVSECFGARSISKQVCSDSQETKWELALKQQQKEAHSLCHHAIHKLIPMAGAYQQSMLEAVSQASSIYAPDEGEISNHISAILYNARKTREANRKANKMEDSHMKAVIYHNSVLPYIETLRFHIDSLNAIIA